MEPIRKLTDSEYYLLDGRGARFYPKSRLSQFNWVVLPATVARQVAIETEARAQAIDSAPETGECAIVTRGNEVLGWINDKNTRDIETTLPDLFSDGAAGVESWYLRWEDSLPREAREELAVLLVEIDDELMY